nr:MAG TPA: hypothetical protein [Caudoviricetes sp.]
MTPLTPSFKVSNYFVHVLPCINMLIHCITSI